MTDKSPQAAPQSASRRRRKDARPAELLDAAFREFAEKGFRGTRLEDVAARAGVVKGTIYLYYGSKQELFEAAVRSRMLPVIGQVQGLATDHEGPVENLLRFVIETLYLRLADPDVRTLIRILIVDGPEFPDLLAFYHREFVAKMVGVLGALVRQGIERGEFRNGAFAEVPQVVMAPGLMAAFWQMTFAPHQPVSFDQFRAAHVDLVLGGLRRRD